MKLKRAIEHISMVEAVVIRTDTAELWTGQRYDVPIRLENRQVVQISSSARKLTIINGQGEMEYDHHIVIEVT